MSTFAIFRIILLFIDTEERLFTVVVLEINELFCKVNLNLNLSFCYTLNINNTILSQLNIYPISKIKYK